MGVAVNNPSFWNDAIVKFLNLRALFLLINLIDLII